MIMIKKLPQIPQIRFLGNLENKCVGKKKPSKSLHKTEKECKKFIHHFLYIFFRSLTTAVTLLYWEHFPLMLALCTSKRETTTFLPHVSVLSDL